MNVDDARALAQLPVRPVREVLRELVRIGDRARARGGSEPDLVLHLTSGATVVGRALGYDPEHGVALCATESSLIYVNASWVGAIEVRAARELAHLLAFDGPAPDAVAPADAGPAPSKLKLSRRLQEVEARLAERLGRDCAVQVAWDHLPPGEEPLRAVGALLEETAGVLTTLAEDDFARAVVNDKVERVLLREGDPGAALEARTLVLTARHGRAEAGRLEGHALLAAVEKVL